MRVQAWASRLLQLLAIELRVRGRPVTQGPAAGVQPHLLARHRGAACGPALPLRLQVRGAALALIGALAEAAGTLFIERASRRDAMRVVHDMSDSLRQGDVLAVFPRAPRATVCRCCRFTPICCRPRCRPPRRCSRWRSSSSTRPAASARSRLLCGR
jgi:hypothetical protein